jgi:hypothetical protein
MGNYGTDITLKRETDIDNQRKIYVSTLGTESTGTTKLDWQWRSV